MERPIPLRQRAGTKPSELKTDSSVKAGPKTVMVPETGINHAVKKSVIGPKRERISPGKDQNFGFYSRTQCEIYNSPFL